MAVVEPIPGDAARGDGFASPEEIRQYANRIAGAASVALLLDYDGTLVPFTPTPALAAPDDRVLALIGALAARAATAVHLVSGRPRESLENWLGELPVGLHAEHGAWSRDPGTLEWQRHPEVCPVPYDELVTLLERFTTGTPGALIERKSAGLAWHYRLVRPVDANRLVEAMIDEVQSRFPPETVEVLRGEKLVEFRPAGIHKGLIVTRVRAGLPPDTLLVAVGDDATDEDMFAALPPEGVSIHVGPRPSRAALRLRDVEACREFLEGLLNPPPAAP
jgi:trehalose 6-phosphate synthase/phosphatase